MKTKFLSFISMSLLLVIGLTFSPITSVLAQSVLSVSPATIVNDVTNVITIAGTGFDNTAVVLLDGTPLATTFVDAQTLTATVPAGVAADSYTITVTVNGVAANGFAILQVNNPPPPPATKTPLPFSRPQFVVHSTKLTGTVQKGKEIKLNVVVENLGQSTAYNTQAVFTSTDLIPTKTGGVVLLGTAPFDDEKGLTQSFFVSADVTGQTIFVVDMTLTYYDGQGTSYSDKFTLSVPVSGASISTGGGPALPTATPTGIKSSQLVITKYEASLDPLQPGEQFVLNLSVQNVGNLKAQRITMIVGGGSSGGGSGGTPQPGGVSGGSGDFANFAPVGASNVQSLGDLGAGETIKASQNLIVNVNTTPGAYPVRISLSYLNQDSEVITDEQVITLLVYSLPSVDVSFYRPPDPFFVGQPGALPIQVVNLGKRTTVLGNFKLSAESGFIENGTSLVGSLDAGGYFTLDSFFTPDVSGPQSLEVTIEYVDDFNQARTVTKTLEIEVMEAFIEPTPDPSIEGGGGGGGFVEEETTLHKIFRFLKGLFGLDSAWPVWQPPGGSEEPRFEEAPAVPLPSGKG